MAGKADGTITIEILADAEGFEAGSERAQRAIKSLKKCAEDQGMKVRKAVADAGNATSPAADTAEKDLQKVDKAIAAQEKKLTDAKAKLQDYYSELDKIKAGTDEMLPQATTDEMTANVLSIEAAQIDALNQKYAAQLETVRQITAELERQ